LLTFLGDVPANTSETSGLLERALETEELPLKMSYERNFQIGLKSVTSLPRDIISLWPDGPPTTLDGVGPEVEFRGAVGTVGDAAMLRNVSDPTLTVYKPTNGKPNGTGVIVCPGGGWRILAWEHEGVDVANWLAAHGYTAFLLKYRVRGTPAAQADYDAEMAQIFGRIDATRKGKTAFRAMSDIVPAKSFSDARAAAADDGRRAVAIVRERAREWDIDSAKVGMIGFSAGAFLVVDIAVDPRAAPLAFVAAIYSAKRWEGPYLRMRHRCSRVSPRTMSCCIALSRVSIPTGPTPDVQLNCTSTGAATTDSAWRSRECRQIAGSINSATGSPIWHSRSSIGCSGRTSVGS
jgi:hypothetical protein